MSTMFFLSFERARSFVHQLGLRTTKDWIHYCSNRLRPKYIPANPWIAYRDEWQSWDNWLIDDKILPFEEACNFARNLNLNSEYAWQIYCNSGEKPTNIPRVPQLLYKEQWQGWDYWLLPKTTQFVPFNKARSFARKLGLELEQQWQRYCATNKIPTNIPQDPHVVYTKEWRNWRDWLQAPISQEAEQSNFLSFEEAREFVHGLNLKSVYEWKQYKKPSNIPEHPEKLYKAEWRSWRDWLLPYSTPFLPFEEARKFARSLGLNLACMWYEFRYSDQMPLNIPLDPYSFYKGQWSSWRDWLSEPKIQQPFKKPDLCVILPFEEARKLVRGLKLKSIKEWQQYCVNNQKAPNIPHNPRKFYPNEWQGWDDWLQTSASQNSFLLFEEAREFVRSLNLQSIHEWKQYKKPFNIPEHPEEIYKRLWHSWRDWLFATNTSFLPFDKAREFVRNLKLKSVKEWYQYRYSDQIPLNIPKYPNTTYKEQWTHWRDWLGHASNEQAFVEESGTEFLSFEEARELAHGLKLKSKDEWQQYCASEQKSPNVPFNPKAYYFDRWQGWDDWLKIEYLSFEEARAFVHKLGLHSIEEWKQYNNKPSDIPYNPAKVYPQWQGWRDWLGKTMMPFEEARKFAHTLQIKSSQEWLAYWLCERPMNLPGNPKAFYPNEWQGWSDWLGSSQAEQNSEQFLSFEEARKIANKLQITSKKCWYICHYKNKFTNIPRNPHHVYKDQWRGWFDWFGLMKFLPFEEAREFVRNLGFTKQRQWRQYCRGNKPSNIPSTPYAIYKDKWQGWEDWLGYPQRRIRGEPMAFEEARKLVRSLGLRSTKQWRIYCKSGNKPPNLPTVPVNYYNEWQGWSDWFGIEGFLPFTEAREFVHKLGIKSDVEWRQYCKSGKKPANIPTCPRNTYRNEWKNSGDWFGTGTISVKIRRQFYLSFTEARELVHSLHLNTIAEWYEACKTKKIPQSIPCTAEIVYKNEWKGWANWLGNETSRRHLYLPFAEARKFAHTLHLNTITAWQQAWRTGKVPKNIPINVQNVYKNEWQGWADWLGPNKKSWRPRKPVHLPFIQARKIAQSLHLNSITEWREAYRLGKIPQNIPCHVEKIYKKEWLSWSDWLGR